MKKSLKRALFVILRIMHSRFRHLYKLSVLILLLGVGLSIATATAASSSSSSAVTQSYNAGSSVLPSMIVEFKPKDKTTVIPLDSSSVSSMLGVVIPSNNATIVLSPENVSTQQVLVAPSGRYNVLVSNENGTIKAGDYLTISALPGISMKADASQGLIVGRAVNSFSARNTISEVTLKNSQSPITHVSVERIVVDVQLAPNPLYLKNSNSIFVFLSRSEFAVTNKQASPLKTYLSGLVLLATIIIAGVVLYAGTRSAIISIGRNPLAKSVIGRSMIKTIVAGIVVFAIGVSVVYLILNQ